MGRENPELPPQDPPPPAEEDTEELPPEQQPSNQEETSVDIAKVPDTAKDSKEVETDDIVEDITPPSLDSVIVDDVLISVDENKEVKVEEGSLVKITGSADVGNEVVILIGDMAYTSIADESGNWFVLVDTSEFDALEYDVLAQSKNDKNEGSEKISLFTLDLSLIESTEEVSEDKSDDSGYVYFSNMIANVPVLVFLGFLFFGLVFLLFVLIKRRKEKEEKKEDISA
jgi:hypothetical protein